MRRVRDARPLIRWHAECYHYEYRSHTRVQVRQCLVHTHFASHIQTR